MKAILVIAALATLCGASPIDERVVGGVDAEISKYPYICIIKFENQMHCGGSIVGKRHILTAAHCVIGFDHRKFTVHCGTDRLDVVGTKRNVVVANPHPAYDQVMMAYDIATLQLDSDLIFSSTIKQIQLATSIPDGTMCDLVGWGFKKDMKPTNKLQHIALKKIDLDTCQKRLDLYPQQLPPLNTGEICTFNKLNEGSCKGDSGGPLVAGGKQVGVVSWGIPCAKAMPDMFTSVPLFKPWIEAYVPDAK